MGGTQVGILGSLRRAIVGMVREATAFLLRRGTSRRPAGVQDAPRAPSPFTGELGFGAVPPRPEPQHGMKVARPCPADEPEEILDWDIVIDPPPPPKRSGIIKVRLVYMGRDKPLPIDDPEA